MTKVYMKNTHTKILHTFGLSHLTRDPVFNTDLVTEKLRKEKTGISKNNVIRATFVNIRWNQ